MKLIDGKNTLGDIRRVVRHITTILFYMAVGGLVVLLFYPIYGQKTVQSSNNCITISTGAVVYLNPVITVEPTVLPYSIPKTGSN